MRAVLVATVTLILLGAREPWAAAEEPGGAQPLQLSIDVRPGLPGGVRADATLRNAGTTPLTIHLPEFYEAIPFPAWRFTRTDGAVFAPYAAPFQSMWKEGDQGTLVTLPPGGTWTTQRAFDLFVRAGADGSGLTPLPLDAGTWTAVCAYEQPDATIPVGGPDFTTTRRQVAGLWTGRVESNAVKVGVRQPAVVSLRIDAPRDVVPGAPYLLTVTARNDTGRLASVPGVLTVSATSKPHGTFMARVILDDPPRAARVGETQTLGLGVAAVRTYVVDLAALPWEGLRTGAKPTSLAAGLGQGIFALDASFAHPDEPGRLDSNGLWRYVVAAPQAAAGR